MNSLDIKIAEAYYRREEVLRQIGRLRKLLGNPNPAPTTRLRLNALAQLGLHEGTLTRLEQELKTLTKELEELTE